MYQSHWGYTLVGTLLGIASSLVSLRASALQGDSVRMLQDVVVTERLRTIDIVPAQRLSGKELERLSSVGVADALRYFSGVQIKDYGGIGGLKTINIRSMGSQHVGVFYDGIKIGNAQNGQVDLSRFSLDNIETLSIYNAQKSSLLQPATHFASSSSVYMSTRHPRFGADEHVHLKVSGRAGSFSTLNPSVLYEQKLSQDISLSVSGEYLYTSGRYPFTYRKANGYDTTATRHNGDVHALRLDLSAYGEVQQGSWQAKAYLYDSERGYPGAVVRELPGVFRHEDRQWDRNVMFQGIFRKSMGAYTLLLSGKYANDYLHYLSDPNKDTSTMYVDNHYRQQEVYLSSVHQWELVDWWRIALASDWQYNTLDADLYGFAYPMRLSALTSLATNLQFRHFKVQANLLHNYIKDWTKASSVAGPSRSIYTPSVVLSYQPFSGEDLQLRAFYKTIFRMPTFNDLYYTFIGSKDLRPEQATQYNIGLSYQRSWAFGLLRQVSCQIDTYLNYIDDKIIAMPTSNQFQWTMVNLGHVRIRGIDSSFSASWRFGKLEATTLVNYTYQKAQDQSSTDSPYYGGQIAYIPYHSGSLAVGFSWAGWGLNYSTIYTGERWDGSANIRENYIQPWYTHDLSLTKTMRFTAHTLRLALEINNLLNQQYEVVRSYPMPGTNFKFKLEWSI